MGVKLDIVVSGLDILERFVNETSSVISNSDLSIRVTITAKSINGVENGRCGQMLPVKGPVPVYQTG